MKKSNDFHLLLQKWNSNLKMTGEEDDTESAPRTVKSMQLPIQEQKIDDTSTAIGIDLGTTYSCVAVCIQGKVTVIENELGKITTPSWIAFREDGSFTTGEVAKSTNSSDPAAAIFDAKRLIGRKFSDYVVQNDMEVWPFQVVDPDGTDTPKIQVYDKTYYPEEISARILLKMKKIAEDHLGKPVKNAVVTVPAYFKNGQRQATKDAGAIAGLNIIKIINEPTAAAIAYNVHRRDNSLKTVLIFDLGGGTLDITVLTMEGENIEVKAVGGDTHLGGQDFDYELVKHYIEKFREKYGIDIMNAPKNSAARALRRIWNACETNKCYLSTTNDVRISIDAVFDGKDLEVRVKKDEFERLNQTKFRKCITLVESVLNEANLSTQDINDVVLVGGSTRIPKIREMLSTFFGGKLLIKDLNPDEAVARGAAVQAAILSGKQAGSYPFMKTLAQDVVPFSLGIENTYDVDEKMCVLIPKNTIIPFTKYQSRTTVADCQTSTMYEIFEGEDPIAKNNYLLGEFTLTGIPSAKAGEEDIEVKMEIDKNGILKMTATVESNKIFNSITILPNQGRLTAGQIEELKLKLNQELE